jgi:Na+/H+ antiporter NhaD/arsenite permease-like protein
MLAVAVLLISLSRRSETLRGLLDRRDERIVSLDLRATAVAGWLVIMAVLISFVVEIAKGHSGIPYSWLAALAGTGYLGALIWLRARR